MKYDESSKARCSKGSLLKKYSYRGETIIVDTLDVHTAERINRRVSASVKQNEVEKTNSLKIASKLYTH